MCCSQQYLNNEAGGHCKNLAPAWKAAATNLKGIVKVAAINCDEEKELAGMFQIQGLPKFAWDLRLHETRW